MPVQQEVSALQRTVGECQTLCLQQPKTGIILQSAGVSRVFTGLPVCNAFAKLHKSAAGHYFRFQNKFLFRKGHQNIALKRLDDPANDIERIKLIMQSMWPSKPVTMA